MLSDSFLSRLGASFPSFYDQVNAAAMADAQRLLREANGDVSKAIVRARFEGAGRIWWPYVRGTVPVVGDDLPAMRAFSRLVLTIDHVVGYTPASVDAARDQVVGVLRKSLDVERLQRLMDRREKEDARAAAAGAAAGAGLFASVSALAAPLSMARSARRWGRMVPAQFRLALGAVVVAALLSVPFVAGYSAGQHAEAAARRFGDVDTVPRVKGQDPRISV